MCFLGRLQASITGTDHVARPGPSQLSCLHSAREWETGDPVLALGQIVHQYIEHYNGDPWSSDPCLAGEEDEEEDDDNLEKDMHEGGQE